MLILYTTEDGESQIQLRAEDETVWLTQLEMADLFNATKQNISLHLKNIFEDGESAEVAIVKESLTVAALINAQLPSIPRGFDFNTHLFGLHHASR